jgi:guanylate kinase
MKQQGEGKGMLVIVSGPSGVGKSTICRSVVAKLDNAFLSISMTTRPKSDTETDGKDYWFVSRDEFEEKMNQGQLLEYAEVFGNLYGTPKDKVDQALAEGKIVILEIDVQGGRQVKNVYPDAVMIFILPPRQGDLVVRMDGRGREDKESAKKRLDMAEGEIAAAWRYYNNMVINDNLEQAVDEVIEIINQATGE